MAIPIPDAILTAHARDEMARRDIEEAVVLDVLANPEQRISVRAGRDVLQGRKLVDGNLIRVFVDIDRDPPKVVTAYRTSKVGKYWSPP